MGVDSAGPTPRTGSLCHFKAAFKISLFFKEAWTVERLTSPRAATLWGTPGMAVVPLLFSKPLNSFGDTGLLTWLRGCLETEKFEVIFIKMLEALPTSQGSPF